MESSIVFIKDAKEATSWYLVEDQVLFGEISQVQLNEKSYLLVGIKQEQFTEDIIRHLAGNIRKKLNKNVFNRVYIDFHQLFNSISNLSTDRILLLFFEGWFLSGYQFAKFKSKKPQQNIELVFDQKFNHHAETALRRAESVCVARDLCNEPANQLTPDLYANKLEELFEGSKVNVSFIKGKDLTDRGFHATQKVGKGSINKPIVALLSLQNGSQRHISLVGKGVTFDSGGTNTKQASNIVDMKMDMGGSAAVVGAMKLLNDLDVNVNVTTIIPIVTNVSGGKAYLPSDVIQYANGLTVEVGNTDAEGRLILADGLLYAQSIGADTIIDIATLTGTIGQALGLKYAGLFCNKMEDFGVYHKIGEQSGDPVWPMPLEKDYQMYLESETADISNVGSCKFGGAIIAAQFLSNFIDNHKKWIHIDMANTVKAYKLSGYYTAGATGFGVRLIVDLIQKEVEQYVY
ncbi:M17 family metallopeptidase [Aquibacillus saliphilus]|uniref:M17 family metallopeptidase n=1 Tax=Aquibacillus saliphilus TaxID=1909422 RepID=UPI001CEFD275|nr:leucyl aminopeptidase family protein [Aquibacillus saliphilus]